MDYLKETQYIAHVDEQDAIIDKVERWEAHEKGILHRAFTFTLLFEGQYLLQYRKHPVFNECFDATISSHQMYMNDELQSDEEAIYKTLEREWYLSKKDLLSPIQNMGSVTYKAQDPKSIYIEHEVCHIYSAEIKELKLPNFEMAYGFCLKRKEELRNPFDPLYPLLAPWVHTAMQQNIL